jgi:hypothetical protein
MTKQEAVSKTELVSVQLPKSSEKRISVLLTKKLLETLKLEAKRVGIQGRSWASDTIKSMIMAKIPSIPSLEAE